MHPEPTAEHPERILSPEVVASYFAELGTYERHFNEMQSRYRTLASTWLLAAIGAIGFILTRRIHVSVDSSLLVASVGLAGASGVALLWNLDLLVYHRLLDAVFKSGLQLEADNPAAPQVRRQMNRVLRYRGATPRVAYYYLVTTGALLVVGLIAFLVWVSGPLGYWAAAPGAALFAGSSACLWLMYRASCVEDLEV